MGRGWGERERESPGGRVNPRSTKHSTQRHTIRPNPPRRTSAPSTTGEALRCHDGSCFTANLSERNFRYSSRPPDIRGGFDSDWDNRRDPVRPATLLSLFGGKLL